MSNTTTTVSRRRFMTKTKPGQRQSTPAASRVDDSEVRAGKASVSEPPSRPYSRPYYGRRPQVEPTPWWKTWLTVTLANVVAVAVFGGLYAWVDSAGSGDGRDSYRSAPPPQTVAYAPSAINIRPMGYSSSRSFSTAPARSEGAVSGDPMGVDEVNAAMADGSQKLELPSNVSGKCSIGDGGSKDFGRCLAQNGAHAK